MNPERIVRLICGMNDASGWDAMLVIASQAVAEVEDEGVEKRER